VLKDLSEGSSRSNSSLCEDAWVIFEDP